MKQVVTNDLYNIFLYLFLHVNKQAVDGGKPALSATVAVHIIVTDTNDHAPSFPQLNYEYNITTTEPQIKVCFHKSGYFKTGTKKLELSLHVSCFQAYSLEYSIIII